MDPTEFVPIVGTDLRTTEMSLRDKAREIREAGERDRGDYAPKGVPDAALVSGIE